MTLEGSYHIVGQMNDWHVNSQNQMQFIDGKYRLSMYLKQGYYNYHIAFKHGGEKSYSTIQTEGSFSQTNNVYMVLVYYRDFADAVFGWSVYCDSLCFKWKTTF